VNKLGTREFKDVREFQRLILLIRKIRIVKENKNRKTKPVRSQAVKRQA
jgi:hypothetical protein